MDAKITKQRLGNFLAYDWLKILLTVAAVALALTLFFTMVGTRPSSGQSFEIYGYYDVNCSSDFYKLDDELEKKNTFSYEILTVTYEKFSRDSTYGNSVFTARRAAGEGTVMFVSDFETFDDEGKQTGESTLKTLTSDTLIDAGEQRGAFYDAKYFMSISRAYLAEYFGADLTGALDEKKAEESFLARNSKDKRFLSASKKKAGIEQEKERLNKLKADYLNVQAAFENGALSFREYQDEDGTSHSGGIGLGGLKKIANLCSYTNGETEATDDLALLIFSNNYGKQSELRFDTLSFLSYLVENYG